MTEVKSAIFTDSHLFDEALQACFCYKYQDKTPVQKCAVLVAQQVAVKYRTLCMCSIFGCHTKILILPAEHVDAIDHWSSLEYDSVPYMDCYIAVHQ